MLVCCNSSNHYTQHVLRQPQRHGGITLHHRGLQEWNLYHMDVWNHEQELIIVSSNSLIKDQNLKRLSDSHGTIDAAHKWTSIYYIYTQTHHYIIYLFMEQYHDIIYLRSSTMILFIYGAVP